MEDVDDKIVFPGDEVGKSEEWLPGKGTYEEEGTIYASLFGKLTYDEEDLKAEVEAVNPVVEIKVDDSVYGSVIYKKSQLVDVQIDLVEGESRDILRDIVASIHVSRVCDDYTEDIEEEFLVGDVVRAKVVQVDPTIRLSTVGQSYGVVRGYCSECRKAMKMKGDNLYCPNCDKVENRKVSNAYGKIKMKER